MFGKIVQLRGIPLQIDFEVVDGIYNIDCDYKHDERYLLNHFATISFANLDPEVTRTYIYGGYYVREKSDGFKDILICNGELSSDDKEEYLLVIIPHALQLVTNCKRIAGRYYSEAILEMHNGDTVEVSKSLKGERETYMAIQAGNEMFLVKKNR